METFNWINRKWLVLFSGAILISWNAEAQFIKSLKKKAEESAKRTVERKVEQKTEETTEKVVDGVFDAPGNIKISGNKDTTDPNQGMGQNRGESSGPNISIADQFIPNGEISHADNFSSDAIGDFPSKWETNTGGEVITIDDFKALRTAGTGYYVPMIPHPLPENYAVEFDFFTHNLDYKNSTPTRFSINFTDASGTKKTKSGAKIEVPLWYNGATRYLLVENWGTSNRINNKIDYNFTDKINGMIHFTIVKNGKRVRVYMDSDKVVDIPSLASDDIGKYIQFHVRNVDLQKNLVVAIANLSIKEEGEDLRSKLLKAEGFSTTAILFDSGSDNIKPSSFEFLNQLGTVLTDDENISLQIIGHTDSDGDAKANQTLSERRALAVKNYITTKFGLEDSRLIPSGKGESEPLNNNSNASEKAANRRVEFKKL
ncbi:OmpA family protein [Belliella marina]|uniref:OmpA family protein n=1 Tax=Belliella marina TaxID=1644146 RepID=A0ABW4VIW6_9BACT